MPGIDESLTFQPLNIAVLTVSDTRTPETDTSGDTLAARIEAAGHTLAARAIIRDKKKEVRKQVRQWTEDESIDVIITTGGTGLTGRDVTVEAVTPLFDKAIDGFSVLFHLVSIESVGTSTIQSRACAGLAGETLIFCLPGSTGAVKDGWDKILAHQLDSRHKPCNFAEIMPRFGEK
jgi:molybdenum cofactor biosynthesis protein B